jgi:hypothetical protein
LSSIEHACCCPASKQVLGSAYPWIARRLLVNQTPELRATLRALLYSPTGRFRFARLESLLQVSALPCLFCRAKSLWLLIACQA